MARSRCDVNLIKVISWKTFSRELSTMGVSTTELSTMGVSILYCVDQIKPVFVFVKSRYEATKFPNFSFGGVLQNFIHYKRFA